VTDFPDLKMKALVNFPASVIGGAGVDVVKQNGRYQFDLAFSDFAPPVAGVLDPPHQNALLWNSLTGLYSLVPISVIGSGGAVAEAPNDGIQYGRQSLGWTPITGGGGGIVDAPSDGVVYSRRNAAWSPVREKLTAARTYYVAATGSDTANNGLTAGSPFKTIQKAIDIVASLDISIYNVTIQAAAGTYTNSALVNGFWVGLGVVTIAGDTTTPSNCLWSVSDGSASCLNAKNGSSISVQGFKFVIASGFAHLYSQTGAIIMVSGKCEFGNSTAHQIVAENARVYTGAPEILSGTTGGWHYFSTMGGLIMCQNATWTASGTWTGAGFAQALLNGVVYAFNNTFSGSFVGQRYFASMNGCVTSNGGGANYFPGNAAGSIAATGGQYA
jgi:hypothetical protein